MEEKWEKILLRRCPLLIKKCVVLRFFCFKLSLICLNRSNILSFIQILWSPRTESKQVIRLNHLTTLQGSSCFSYVSECHLCVRICSFPIYNLTNGIFQYMWCVQKARRRLGLRCVFWNFLSNKLACSNNSRCCQTK